jgi:hypothetical protein
MRADKQSYFPRTTSAFIGAVVRWALFQPMAVMMPRLSDQAGP